MTKKYTLVAGLGKTGQSVARYLTRKNEAFILFDTRQHINDLDAIRAQFPQATIHLHALPEELYPQIKEIIASPGISPREPFLQKAQQQAIPVIGDIECLAREVSAPMVGITGTNGKSTVTALLGEMAKAAGIKVAVGGNIGTPVLDLLGDGNPYELWVLELSSFQLDLTEHLALKAAALLNISQDHLDRYTSYAEYVHSKKSIFRCTQYQVCNRQDNTTYPNPEDAKAVITFGLDVPQAGHWGIVQQNGSSFLAKGSHCLLSIESLKLKGKQNWQNALAACILADKAGIDEKSMACALESFPGLPHRCQWVRTLNEVVWINDSKGTNVGATQSAVCGLGEAMQGKIILIAGGIGKGADFNALRACVQENVRAVVAMGEDAAKIAAALSEIVSITLAQSMEDAVAKANALAKPGDTVLLSPACASFDMFRDFNHRGEVFQQQVNKL